MLHLKTIPVLIWLYGFRREDSDMKVYYRRRSSSKCKAQMVVGHVQIMANNFKEKVTSNYRCRQTKDM
jgi:hypothetical protein